MAETNSDINNDLVLPVRNKGTSDPWTSVDFFSS